MEILWRGQVPLAIDLEKTANSGQCFRWKALGEGVYAIPNGQHCLIAGPGPTPETLYVDVEPQTFMRDWAGYFDASRDYAAICRTAQADPFLRQCAAAAAGIRVLHQDLWEMMVTFLVSQNNNIPRIRASIERMCARCGSVISAGTEAEIMYAFPTPAQLCENGALDGLGLGYRDKYIAALAQNVQKGTVSLDALKSMDYAEAHASLTRLYGIGPKVADCICLFGLGHADAFPMDTWMKKVTAAVYAGHFPLEQYPGCAGIVQQWIFYAVQSGRVSAEKA